jgi:hypothetical protein
MLDTNKITPKKEANIQPLIDVLGECNIDVLDGTTEGEDECVFLIFEGSHDASMFISALIQTDETDESSLSSRVLNQDSVGENSWSYKSVIHTNFKDHAKPGHKFGFSMWTMVTLPVEDYDEVLIRVTKYRDIMLEPVDESCKIAGFCKGCFIVDLERLIEIDEFAILNPKTGESHSGSEIESVSKNGEVVEISLTN